MSKIWWTGLDDRAIDDADGDGRYVVYRHRNHRFIELRSRFGQLTLRSE
jgi:hypothetical protein